MSVTLQGDPAAQVRRLIFHCSKYIESCIECAKNSKWPEEALGRAKFHLALLYEMEGVGEETQVRTLRAEAKVILDKYSIFTAKCAREKGSDLVIFDDLQPTFLGRYLGRKLLEYLQDDYRLTGENEE